MSAAKTRAEQAKAGIAFHAKSCEECLRSAAFAEEQGLAAGMSAGLRKLAGYHSEHAFGWARTLARAQGGAQ